MTGEQIVALIRLKEAFGAMDELGIHFDVELANCEATCSELSNHITLSRIIASDGYDQIDVLNGAIASMEKQDVAPIMRKWMEKYAPLIAEEGEPS